LALFKRERLKKMNYDLILFFVLFY
jgi:hypothetical protein